MVTFIILHFALSYLFSQRFLAFENKKNRIWVTFAFIFLLNQIGNLLWGSWNNCLCHSVKWMNTFLELSWQIQFLLVHHHCHRPDSVFPKIQIQVPAFQEIQIRVPAFQEIQIREHVFLGIQNPELVYLVVVHNGLQQIPGCCNRDMMGLVHSVHSTSGNTLQKDWRAPQIHHLFKQINIKFKMNAVHRKYILQF